MPQAVPQDVTKQAQQALRRYLEQAFGPRLLGVRGFGAGLDHETRQMALRVMVDGPSSARQAKKVLPKMIKGLPVMILERGLARADGVAKL